MGIGFDIHPLVKDEKLILGGVEIDYKLGLKGHSDADVLVHAVMDAILGALGKGDIGVHFPDDEDRYKGINSLKLLEKVYKMMCEDGFSINNLDAIVIAERPKIKPYVDLICDKLARYLEINSQVVNVKATTAEGLGFIGRGEGIAVQAIVSLQKNL